MPLSTLIEEERTGEAEGGVLGEPDFSDEGVLGLDEAEEVEEWESDAELETEERGVNAKLDSLVKVGGGDTGRGETEGEMVGDAVVSGEGKEMGEGKVEAEVALVGPCLKSGNGDTVGKTVGETVGETEGGAFGDSETVGEKE